jgi:uncharacterized protein (TIGR02466 family)
MNFKYIFPTCVFEDQRNDFVSSLLPVVNEYLDKYGVPFSDYPNHISTYNNFNSDILLHTDNRLDEFKEYIHSSTIKYFKHQNIDCNYNLSPFLSLNKMSMSSYHETHAHANSIISGLIYLDVSDDCPPIVFKDPRAYRNFVLYTQGKKLNDIESLSPNYVVKPKTGMILMWPSWMEHEVPISNSINPRTTLVFNLGEPYANVRIS